MADSSVVGSSISASGRLGARRRLFGAAACKRTFLAATSAISDSAEESVQQDQQQQDQDIAGKHAAKSAS